MLEVGRLLGPMLENEYIVMDALLPFLQSVLEESSKTATAGLPDVVVMLNGHISNTEVSLSTFRPPLCEHEARPCGAMLRFKHDQGTVISCMRA
jgi:hypothetical protein